MGEMKEICETEGIKLPTSVRYSSESNGVTERAIGVLTNVVRAMLRDSDLPKSNSVWRHTCTIGLRRCAVALFTKSI